jgi:FKBP-type peptidyl-prolyl cis-trans isomerase
VVESRFGTGNFFLATAADRSVHSFCIRQSLIFQPETLPVSIWKPWHQRSASPSKSRRGKRTSHGDQRRARFSARFEQLENRALLTTVSGDFNGDGIADLAIGNPAAAVNGHASAGSVQIIYGTVPSASANSDGTRNSGLTGISAVNSLLITKASTGLNSSPAANDQFGAGLAVGDFNGDGIADLAIGVPGQTVSGAAGAGAVYILYGSRAAGLKTTGAQLWTQNSTNIQGVSEAGDHFGAALAVGDFNDDHHLDLAVGVPNEAIVSTANAGAVNIIFGAQGGLNAKNNQIFYGVNGGAAAGDLFGSALAVGDFNADGFRDLAIGSPGRTSSGLAGAGVVNVLYGTGIGLQTKNMQTWAAGSGGVMGTATAAGKFGASLAAGDFNDDSRSDLAIGAPGENVGSTTNAGAVHVLMGSSARLTATNNQLWDENNTGVTGAAAASGDQFGASVAAGNMSSDRLGDLAIGVPGKTISGDADAGSVTVLYGAAVSSTQQFAGLGPANAQSWDQSQLTSTGDAASANAEFGSAVAIGDFNGDKIGDLAVEVPGDANNKDSSGTVFAGTVDTIFGTSTGLNAGGTGNNEATQVWLPAQKQVFPDTVRQRQFNSSATAAKNLAAGNAFLAANKTKPGVITLADGVQYKVISSNPSGAIPTDSNMVTVNYTGTLIDGTVFDSSASHGGPQTFAVTGVVPGFAEALKHMHVGDHITVYIPASLGYGTTGQYPTIPPNSVIIFDLQLLSIS